MRKDTSVALKRRLRSSATTSTASTGAAVSAAVNTRGRPLCPRRTAAAPSITPYYQHRSRHKVRQSVSSDVEPGEVHGVAVAADGSTAVSMVAAQPTRPHGDLTLTTPWGTSAICK